MSYNQQVTFLDLEIEVNDDRTLSSNLYRKPTTGNTILQAQSFHPKLLVQSIPYSQYLRIRCNCCDEAKFKKATDELKLGLLETACSKSALRRAYNCAIMQPRSQLLFGPHPPWKEEATLRIKTPYCEQHSVHKYTHNYWHLLPSDPKIAKIVSTHPQITFKWASSLCDRLVSSSFTARTELPATHSMAGTFPCGSCNYCKYICSNPTSPLLNGHIFRPKRYVDCQTTGVIHHDLPLWRILKPFASFGGEYMIIPMLRKLGIFIPLLVITWSTCMTTICP